MYFTRYDSQINFPVREIKCYLGPFKGPGTRGQKVDTFDNDLTMAHELVSHYFTNSTHKGSYETLGNVKVGENSK